MKPIDIMIIAVIAVLLFLAIRYSVRHRDEACDGNCSSCPYVGKCGKARKKQ